MCPTIKLLLWELWNADQTGCPQYVISSRRGIKGAFGNEHKIRGLKTFSLLLRESSQAETTTWKNIL